MISKARVAADPTTLKSSNRLPLDEIFNFVKTKRYNRKRGPDPDNKEGAQTNSGATMNGRVVMPQKPTHWLSVL